MTNYVSLWHHVEAFSRIAIQNRSSHCEQTIRLSRPVSRTEIPMDQPDVYGGHSSYFYSPYCYPTAPIICYCSQLWFLYSHYRWRWWCSSTITTVSSSRSATERWWLSDGFQWAT